MVSSSSKGIIYENSRILCSAVGKFRNTLVLTIYDIDEHFPEHQMMSDVAWQPSMNRDFRNADEFFGRSVEEYGQWLLTNTREQLDFVMLDLIRLSWDQLVLCDCHLTMEQAAQLSDISRVAFMLKKPENLVKEYCNRPDHQGFSDFIVVYYLYLDLAD